MIVEFNELMNKDPWVCMLLTVNDCVVIVLTTIFGTNNVPVPL